MAVKRAPACSSECLVSFISCEGTRQECALTHGPGEKPTESSGFTLLLAERGLGENCKVDPCWVEASLSADLNLLGVMVSSGCFPQAVAG